VAYTLNVIISGASYSGALDVSKTPLTINLGGSDGIGQATFALQNSNGQYSSMLFSGHALFQVDAMQGNTVVKTIFRGTLESASPVVDVDSNTGNQTLLVGYDLAQELLGLVSADARQPSAIDPNTGAISIVSGDQGMGVLTGMDLALYVSGAIGAIPLELPELVEGPPGAAVFSGGVAVGPLKLIGCWPCSICGVGLVFRPVSWPPRR